MSCPHVRVWRGDCCECGEAVAWYDTSTVPDRLGYALALLRRRRLGLAAARWRLGRWQA